MACKHTLAPSHLFVASNGDLHDTRDADWSRHPLRAGFSGHSPKIESVEQFKASVRAGGFAWPGGYPLAFLCGDGGVLCWPCARKEARQIIESIAHRSRDGWRVMGMICIEAGDEPEICEHCNSLIGGE